MKTTKLIATYSRVSTSAQEDQQTIKTQLSTLREYAKKNGYSIVKEYTDDGWSGDMLARPDLDQLRQDAKEKIWDAVLIYDPDRLARRYSYQELVMDELKEAGIEVLFITISTPKNSEDKILHGVRGLFAEYERAKISERFRLGKLRKVKEGNVLVSEPPYGYNYIPKQDRRHGYYEVNPEEARVAKMIFTWIAEEGLTLRKVVRRLQKLGIKPRKSKRGVWSTSTLTTMLRNKTYIGEAHWGSSYAVIPEKPQKIEKYKKMKKTSRRIKPEEDWIIIPVPAIIDKELFQRVRTQLKTNFSLCQRNKKNKYLLSGKVYCVCDKKRSGEGPQRGKHLYYRCTNRVLNFPLPPTCKEGGINARIADKLVWEKIVKLMSSPELLSKQINRWVNNRQNKTEASVGNLGMVEAEIVKLKKQEDRYNKAYGAELFSIERLKEYTLPLRERIKGLESQIVKIKQEAKEVNFAMMPNKKEIELFSKESVKVLSNLSYELKKDIILNTVEKIVGTKEKLQVYGYIPVNTNNYVKYKTSNRHCWFAKCRQINTF